MDPQYNATGPLHIPGSTSPGRDGVVLPGLLCHGCSYDLRGLPVDGCCPECGLPVMRSIRRERLLSLDPIWLSGILWGARALHYTVVAWLLSVPIMVAAAYRDSRELAVSWVILMGAMAAFATYAAWKFTAPAPHLVATEHQFACRRICRVVLGCAAVGSGLMIAFISGSFAGLRQSILYALSAFFLISLVGVPCWCAYCARIADELGGGFPAKRARAYMVCYLLAAGSLLGGVLGVQMAELGACLLILAGPSWLILWVLAIELPNYLTTDLRELIGETKPPPAT